MILKFAHFSHVWNKPGMTPFERYEQLWRELVLCDQLDFDYGFAVEHHFNPAESWMPSPSIYCMGAGARTRKLRVGPMGYIVPLHSPLRMVEEVAVLDQALGGRLELGLVPGIVPAYFQPYGADYQNRRAITLEMVRLLNTAYRAPRESSISTARFSNSRMCTSRCFPYNVPARHCGLKHATRKR